MKTLTNLAKETMKGLHRIALAGMATGCKMV